MNKESLKEKEIRLRKELNQASEDIENRFIKTAGIALIGGLVSYGVYKLFKSKDNQDSASELGSEESVKIKNRKSSNSDNSSNYLKLGTSIIRLASAAAPLIISEVNKNKEE